MGLLRDIKIFGSSEGDRRLVKELFGDVEIQPREPGGAIAEARIKRVTNWYTGREKDPLFLFAPVEQNITLIWPPYDLSPYDVVRFGTTWRIEVPALFISHGETRTAILILTKPEGINLEDTDSFGV